MASVWKRGRYWQITIEDRHGARITTSSHMTRRRDAEELANGLEAKEILAKRLGPDASESTYREAEETPLFPPATANPDEKPSLLDTWKKEMVTRGNTEKHIKERLAQTRSLLELSKVTALSAMTKDVVSGGVGKLRELGLNSVSINHYIRSVKSFSRFLWRTARARDYALGTLETVREGADPKRPRRSMTLPEIRKLLRAADQGKTLWTMTGRDRGMMYRAMLGSGLRVDETRSLCGKHFLWHEAPVAILLYAADAKGRREERQPIRTELAHLLKSWMKRKGIGAEDAVFTMPDKPNRMFKADLAKAGIAVKDEHGRYLDLHSLRHTFITECARHFMPKVTQVLARHASITTTMKYYVHLERAEVDAHLQESPFYGQRKRQKGA